MSQITIYVGKKDEPMVELAKLRKLEISKICMKAVYDALGVEDNTDIDKLIADEEIEKAERFLEEVKLKHGK